MSPDGERVAFELDRFELAGDDRLEVTGRWFGVRGLRFVRPSLTVRTEDGERNLLALLEHKPWAAEEGESWIAAFPWKGGSPDPRRIELSVAPSVVVPLADERKGDMATASRRPGLRERLEKERERVRRLESEVAWLREEREALIADAESGTAERGRLERELAAARQEREAAVRARDEAAGAQSQLEGVREQAGRERAAAFAERDRALADRDAAIRDRDAARAERDAAHAARDRALREQVAAERERERSEQERHALAAERDEAVRASKAALAERDAALGRGSGFPAVSAADLTRQPFAPRPEAPREDWRVRALALGALLVALIVIVVLLKFL